ncbi:hypothetical protein RND71_031244 [Anisodus tanguticus]|uniref:acylphosphatase n=1 Tax=Anisodus tanguticus TaxID=243964 RepID=A0AAE1V4M5_9SOLA|nr:hypothetical protein RND71_031244 [Anisodus tanguticus]
MSSLNSNTDPDAKTVRAVIKGRVQGVFYRDWTVENAKQSGLKGWVRNRRDGSVEALFSGSPEKVQEMSSGVGGVHHLVLSRDLMSSPVMMTLEQSSNANKLLDHRLACW